MLPDFCKVSAWRCQAWQLLGELLLPKQGMKWRFHCFSLMYIAHHELESDFIIIIIVVIITIIIIMIIIIVVISGFPVNYRITVRYLLAVPAAWTSCCDAYIVLVAWNPRWLTRVLDASPFVHMSWCNETRLHLVSAYHQQRSAWLLNSCTFHAAGVHAWGFSSAGVSQDHRLRSG